LPPPGWRYRRRSAFYVYPDFGLWREHLHAGHGVRTGSARDRLSFEWIAAALRRIGGILADLGP
jgi:hypothetical protein